MKAAGKAGRPAVDGATGVKSTSIALTAEQRAWLRGNGGSSAVRRLLDREIERCRKHRENTGAAALSPSGSV